MSSLRRVDGERDAPQFRGLESAQTHAIVTAADEAEHDAPRLPHDHPQWVKDALSVSSRARSLIATLRPLLIRVTTFWDHRVRSITIGPHRLTIDPCGSYRCDDHF